MSILTNSPPPNNGSFNSGGKNVKNPECPIPFWAPKYLTPPPEFVLFMEDLETLGMTTPEYSLHSECMPRGHRLVITFSHRIKILKANAMFIFWAKVYRSVYNVWQCGLKRGARPPCRSRALIRKVRPSSWQISAIVFCNTPVFDNIFWQRPFPGKDRGQFEL